MAGRWVFVFSRFGATVSFHIMILRLLRVLVIQERSAVGLVDDQVAVAIQRILGMVKPVLSAFEELHNSKRPAASIRDSYFIDHRDFNLLE